MASEEMSRGKKRKHSELLGKVIGAREEREDKKIEKLSKDASVTTSKSPSVLTIAKLTSQDDVLALEEAIVVSPRNYNGIVTLLDCLRDFNDPELGITSAVSLCRTFCRLMALGRFANRKALTDAEKKIQQWMKERYKDYVQELVVLLGSGEVSIQTTALTLLMRLLKEEGTQLRPAEDEYCFPHGLMARISKGILYSDFSDEIALREEFVEKYLDAYHDVRYSFLFVTLTLVEQAAANPNLAVFRANLLEILLSMKNLPLETEDYTLSPFYVLDLKKKRKQKPPAIISVNAHRRQLQEIWLATMRLDLTEDQMKSVLDILSHKIVPFFSQPQLLMDFLTDCYNAGGAMSLLALNGLFELIKTKNLDYPNFYEKLYALFDRDLMHVKYRSRFFRLLDIFLASTHIPAILVASFIKRMSRLCLSAPPSTIVIVVPFIYNLLRRHPTCAFMLHREHYDRDEIRKTGMDDPFDNENPDPMKTRALESSLWEIEMLQSHYHPSVATIARIISEQFTKNQYALEDFLDHSYTSMIDAELRKALRKEPVVEYDVPKRLFTVPEAKTAEQQEEDTANNGPPLTPVTNTLTELWAF
ncbi:CBF/Mak21 family-domain-containing protein [Kalaharituber pfeilii]|nr:CBF/Mak21 family-domain-containing protein [Kalaharituber pfeilii]